MRPEAPASRPGGTQSVQERGCSTATTRSAGRSGTRSPRTPGPRPCWRSRHSSSSTSARPRPRQSSSTSCRAWRSLVAAGSRATRVHELLPQGRFVLLSLTGDPSLREAVDADWGSRVTAFTAARHDEHADVEGVNEVLVRPGGHVAWVHSPHRRRRAVTSVLRHWRPGRVGRPEPSAGPRGHVTDRGRARSPGTRRRLPEVLRRSVLGRPAPTEPPDTASTTPPDRTALPPRRG
ncbi:hypothetical protein ACGFOM_30960 [Streptomyces sp. NPDC048594]|uniref:aromatic-ring hydroxylase C-terminal domain-containing protein n=1 Tax=Streptomyces sp. NPDC048594 TaxID=3365575 RepID=UPI00371D113D